jgi:small ligand-binding sensory domain FIST
MQSNPKILLNSLGDWQKQSGYHSAVIHGDPRSAITPALITQLGQILDPVFITGGLSSAEDEHPQIADNITDGGISGVLFADSVTTATTLSQGCTPISTRHQVTSCKRNVITGLDNRPAFDVFREDIGDILARDLDRVGGYIFAGLPIPGSDTGDYTVRNLMAVDPEQQQLVIGDYVQEGQSLLFCKRNGSSAWQDMREKLEKLKKRLNAPIKGGLYFSCLGRGRYLFGENSEEVKFVHEILGDFPMVGFFANGEIANNQLYGYTGVLTLFL